MQKKTLNNIDNRTEMLLGDNFKKLSAFKFAVCGVGGVGSIIPISLVRSGVKNIVIVDFDTVDESNLNRQIAYDTNDIGKAKVICLKEKLIDLREETRIDSINKRIDPNFDFSVFDDCDYVFDCIDDLQAKIELIKYCLNKNINIISSLGMGNRVDPTKIEVTTLNKTHDDPLARKLRYELKQEGMDIKKLKVSFSSEIPIIKSNKVSSMVFVPNTAGLIMTSYVVKELLNLGE